MVAPRVRAAKSSAGEKESSEHLKWTHLEQVITFPCVISSAHRAGKDGARIGMNVTAHQENEEI